jgi:hypothetical protein
MLKEMTLSLACSPYQVTQCGDDSHVTSTVTRYPVPRLYDFSVKYSNKLARNALILVSCGLLGLLTLKCQYTGENAEFGR